MIMMVTTIMITMIIIITVTTTIILMVIVMFMEAIVVVAAEVVVAEIAVAEIVAVIVGVEMGILITFPFSSNVKNVKRLVLFVCIVRHVVRTTIREIIVQKTSRH